MRAVSLNQRGLSLLEVVAATAILSLTVLCVTAVVESSLALQRRAGGAAELERVVDAEAVRLRALPFCGQGDGDTPGPPSLLAETFPHADPSRVSPEAQYLPDADGSSGGTFVTTARVGQCLLRREARFVATDGEQWTPVAAGALLGWDVAAASPPACALQVRLVASRAVAGRQTTAIRCVLVLAVAAATDPGP